MKKLFNLLLYLLILHQISLGQDPNFSQFFSSPLTLNPALTGRFEGIARVAGNYRNQWPTINSAFQTYTISADFAALQRVVPQNDRLGVGIMAFADQQADGVLKNTYYSLSTAYHKGLDENGYHQISIGFQGTFAQKRLNTSNLKFEDQLRSNGFTGITNEIFDPQNLNINYFGLNAGVMFSGVTGGNVNYYAGTSIYHINKPKESFTGADFALQNRFAIHGGAYFPVGTLGILHTSGQFQSQAGAQEASIGGAMGFSLSNDMQYSPVTFYAGSWYRFGDAIIPYIGLEFDKLRFGATYDVNTSTLRAVSNSRGGFEISLIYINNPNGEKGIKCPKF
jgi:type IX secretion system PorP/SprF family membrane protein